MDASIPLTSAWHDIGIDTNEADNYIFLFTNRQCKPQLHRALPNSILQKTQACDVPIGMYDLYPDASRERACDQWRFNFAFSLDTLKLRYQPEILRRKQFIDLRETSFIWLWA